MYSNATFVQSYIIIAVVLEIYRITLLSNRPYPVRKGPDVLEIYRITLLSNGQPIEVLSCYVLKICRITLLSNKILSIRM